MIIEGCILVFLAIILIILLVMIRRLKLTTDYKTYDGIIVNSDTYKKEIIVNYMIDGISYNAPYNCEAYANVGEMPPIRLKVRVTVSPDNPNKILFVQFMRGYGRGGNQKYIDNQGNRNIL
ncbi:MAG: hypothetical protein K2O52_04325, partial [Oscillospiraceae bacterium]|nr:hypothetical protein [Oscillospiraceae bacterium]